MSGRPRRTRNSGHQAFPGSAPDW